MRASEVTNHPVLDVSSAVTVGRIDDVVIDPTNHRVLGFVLGKTAGKATWLAWDHMKALGRDAATIESTDALAEPPEHVPPGLRKGRVLGRRVLSDQGLELGALADVEFDGESGVVDALLVNSGRVLPGETMRGVGTYATVVRHPEDPPG
jgi:uncharacterized protein YrrD